MSSHQDIPSFTNPRNETWFPKKLAASRWAPGGAEDQMMEIDSITDDKPSNIKATTATAKGLASSQWFKDPVDNSPNSKATNTMAKGLSSSRWSTAPIEHRQIDNKKVVVAENKNKLKNENIEKASNMRLNQPRRGTAKRGTNLTTKMQSTPRRIIGPLSEEEQTVKMENPFFDPNKHKGLGSSRWATE